MIAADTSAWLDFTNGIESRASGHLEAALSSGSVVIPIHVLFEILSGPGLTKGAEKSFLELPRLDLISGYWERAASLRRRLLQRKRKARSMDCLIAQNCIDHGVALIVADKDFLKFKEFGLNFV